MSFWVRSATPSGRATLIAGMGKPGDRSARLLGIRGGRLVLWLGAGRTIVAGNAPLNLTVWHMVASTFDGKNLCLYIDVGAHVKVNKSEQWPLPGRQISIIAAGGFREEDLVG